MARKFPAKLFGNFEPVGLRTFCVIAAQIDIRETPPVFFGNLRAQAIHIVVVALDGDDLRTINTRSQDLARLQVVWDKDKALQSQTSRMSRHAVG